MRCWSASATGLPRRVTWPRPSSTPRWPTRRWSSSARTTSGRSPSRLERQTRIPLFKRAAGYGFPGVRVDGNDVLAVEAVVTCGPRARPQGRGTNARGGVHLPHGCAHHLRRPDPLPDNGRGRGLEAQGPDRTRARAHRPAPGSPMPTFLAEVDARADALGEHMRSACRAMPDPSPTSMFDHLYATDHPVVDHDRAWLTHLPRRLLRLGTGALRWPCSRWPRP